MRALRTSCLWILTALAAGLTLGANHVSADDAGKSDRVKFVAHHIGSFRSESCCVADFNNDGKLDIVAGPYLYLAPDWKPQKIRELDGSVNNEGKGYYDDFTNIAIDVDGDGLLDIISCSWFKKRATWYRNTGKAGGLWPESVIETNGNFESARLWDLFGKGQPSVVVPDVQRTAWYELGTKPDGQRGFITHVISEKPMEFGNGVGDINGDGRPDIIRPNAWFEAPADLRNGQWIEHPLSIGGKDGKAGHTPQILVYDVNGDGLPDLVTSSAHGWGIFWYEQVRQGNEISWKQHLIDDTWTQAHALVLADIDNDGVPELIAGKRFMAHNGNDPDEYGTVGVYYYKLTRRPSPVWTKHAISYNEGIGAGLNIEAVDLDGDGDIDLVTTGKWGGPVWFENTSKTR
jgi:hypothetical protein